MVVLVTGGLILGAIAFSVIIVEIADIFNPSPTSIDWCRGGHDF